MKRVFPNEFVFQMVSLIVAMVVLPMMFGVRWLWEMLIHYYNVIRFTVDMPFF